MKKLICLMLCGVIITGLFCGCSKDKEAETEEETVTTTEAVQTVDLDLSEMSGTVVYSEVYNIYSNPDEYIGKVIKIKGNFQVWQDTQDSNPGGFIAQPKTFYSCVIPDATACCQQGVEFVPAKPMNYPADFPPLDTEIIVTGEFTPYTDNGQQYYTLRNSTVEIA